MLIRKCDFTRNCVTKMGIKIFERARGDSGKVDAVKVGIGIIIVILVAFTANYSLMQGEPYEADVVSTAYNLTYFAEEIGGDEIEVHSIVPAGECPGQHDYEPADVSAVAEADLILTLGHEGGWLDDLIEASGNTDVTLNVGPEDPWGPVPGAIKHIENIADVMTSVYPHKEDTIEDRKELLISSVEDCGDDLLDRAQEVGVNDVRVITQQFQKGFVEWIGFEVVEVFSFPEHTSPGELVGTVQDEDVTIIISNRPSGTDVGKGVSSDTGIEHVVLRNFPEDTYCEMIRNNAEILFSAVESYEP